LVNYIEGKRAFHEEMKLKYGKVRLGKGYNGRADNPHVNKDPSLIPAFR